MIYWPWRPLTSNARRKAWQGIPAARVFFSRHLDLRPDGIKSGEPSQSSESPGDFYQYYLRLKDKGIPFRPAAFVSTLDPARTEGSLPNNLRHDPLAFFREPSSTAIREPPTAMDMASLSLERYISLQKHEVRNKEVARPLYESEKPGTLALL